MSWSFSLAGTRRQIVTNLATLPGHVAPAIAQGIEIALEAFDADVPLVVESFGHLDDQGAGYATIAIKPPTPERGS